MFLYSMIAYLFASIGHETPLLEKAEELGYTKAFLIYSFNSKSELNSNYRKKIENTSKILILWGIDCKTQKEAKAKGFDGMFQLGTRNKEIFSGVTHLYNNEYEEEKDFIHQRRSGLNHILLADCARKDIVVLGNSAGLFELSSKKRARVLGRLQQNQKLARKAGVTFEIVHMASTALELRSSEDIRALGRLLQ